MKIKRKAFITFIELLISMALTSLILMLLFYFYRDIDWINQDMEKSQKKAFQISYVQNRLTDTLTNVVSPRTEEKDFYFFISNDANGLLKSGSPSLVFTYDFGANNDPKFANHVLGRLYLDTNNNLSLATWPSPKLWPIIPNVKMNKEILLENVEGLSFRFYVPPEKDRSLALNNARVGASKNGKIKANEIEPDKWHTDWKSEYNALPAIIEVTLKLKEVPEPMKFVYPLPLSDYVIVYDK